MEGKIIEIALEYLMRLGRPNYIRFLINSTVLHKARVMSGSEKYVFSKCQFTCLGHGNVSEIHEMEMEMELKEHLM